jgi:hypothetical protein
MMLLYHSTDATAKARIQQEGFTVAHNKKEQGKSWFHTKKGEHRVAAGLGWWVLVEMPDDVADEWLYPYGGAGEDTTELDRRFPQYHIPFDVVNEHGPFDYEPFSDEDWKAAGVLPKAST